jgi:adenine-specific DNA-methyltransferase
MERLNVPSYREKFQQLLRELFQFDCADLDFGIYRIMNYKRDVVERFIGQDLPKAIADELDRDTLAAQAQAAKELKEIAGQITQTLGNDALDADGNLAEAYHGTPLGKKYMDLKAKAAGGQGREALEASIFNHLITFFSRYYQDGDFISKRRYSKRQRYAIPYNGEEVYLYWANNDQYYVKTAEHFHDYTFTSRGVTVHFKLQAADVEQNNVKGDKRLFLPRVKETEWTEDAGELIIPFEYRPLTEQEEITYGKKNQQDAIIAQAIEEIPKRLKKADKALLAFTSEHHKNSDGEPVTFLEHHLRQYTRRNTSDFFIHKDLKEFLSQELDFYLKNEVLNLDEMENAGEDRAEGWFQIMRVIKTVGGRIIEFLDQIECFQKMLWEKRKFITETQYCITVGNIDKSFYPDIAACEPQWAEWKELFHIDEEQTDLFNAGKGKKDKRILFLKAHPTLVLDTKHYEQAFVDRLLGSFEDLDDMTDGLLVHSENFQALGLLSEKYRHSVKCVYIDPPYNTNASAILYKNEYRHSSWLALIESRLRASSTLLCATGTLCITIDDSEFHRLRSLVERTFGADSVLGCAAIRNNPSGRATPKGFSIAHEYALFISSGAMAEVGRLPHSEEQKGRYADQDEDGSYEWVNFRKHGGANAYRTARPAMFYPIFVGRDGVRIPKIIWDTEKREWRVGEPLRPSEEVILPIRVDGGKSYEMTWKWGVETARKQIHDLCSRKDQHGETGVYRKSRLRLEGTLPRTWWDKKSYSATEHGTNLLTDIMGYANSFPFPKSVYATQDCLKVAGLDEGGMALDYFAGSGTTGHAVINLNREDVRERRFILAEVGEYFDMVTLTRIKKITFTPEWKDGKPKRMATRNEANRGPRIVKYIRLESYEDALNNIEFDDASGQQALKFDDYLIKYMLKWETRASETLLNVEKLARPFSYKLHIHAGGQTREKVADIPETFNYLLGLHVQTRRVYDDDGRRYLVYRGQIDHRQIVVIWRETEGWQKADLERDKKFVAEKKLTEGADEVFVNGDSFIPSARALEPVFKARMFAPVEV